MNIQLFTLFLIEYMWTNLIIVRIKGCFYSLCLWYFSPDSVVKEKTGKKLLPDNRKTNKITYEISMEEFIFPTKVFSTTLPVLIKFYE